jgi:CheY-like chemotaxis protein
MVSRVLVVDDERDVGRLLAYSLDQAGFTVATATTAADALMAAARQPPAVIVLDVGLPDMSGVEVCRRLRADRELAEVGIVMLTAHGGRDDRIAGLEAGADDYVTKPFDIQEVVLRVRALARRISERDQARTAAAPRADRPALLRAWYRELARPTWAPPGWLFGPVWLTLYTAMAVAAWLVWRGPSSPARRAALGWFGVQLALNAAGPRRSSACGRSAAA